MKSYFIEAHSSRQPSNKLQEKVLNHINTNYHHFQTTAPLFEKQVISQFISDSNQEFPRCTPLVVNSYGDDEYFYICIKGKAESICNIAMHEIKGILK